MISTHGWKTPLQRCNVSCSVSSSFPNQSTANSTQVQNLNPEPETWRSHEQPTNALHRPTSPQTSSSSSTSFFTPPPLLPPITSFLSFLSSSSAAPPTFLRGLRFFLLGVSGSPPSPSPESSDARLAGVTFAFFALAGAFAAPGRSQPRSS